ncbi:MAG: hypothetical protein P8182_07255 [Deltaproteobacteria bacterium]
MTQEELEERVTRYADSCKSLTLANSIDDRSCAATVHYERQRLDLGKRDVRVKPHVEEAVLEMTWERPVSCTRPVFV